MEQSPSSQQINRRFPRKVRALLAALGMSGLLLQPSTEQTQSTQIYAESMESCIDQAGQQLSELVTPTLKDLDLLDRPQSHNDRYGVREPLLPQAGFSPSDVMFEDDQSWSNVAF